MENLVIFQSEIFPSFAHKAFINLEILSFGSIWQLVSPQESNSIQNFFAFSVYCAGSAWVNNNVYKLVQVLMIAKIIEKNSVLVCHKWRLILILKVFSVRKIIYLLCIAHMCFGCEKFTHCGLNIFCQVGIFVCNSNK